MSSDISRRQFLVTAGSALTAIAFPYSAFSISRTTIQISLEAAPGKVNIGGETDRLTDVLQYNNSTPGPVIRVPQDSLVSIPFGNQLNQPTTIHWHGVRIDNKMDGVPNLTQETIEPGETFTYRFIPPDAGTFWYHSHDKTWDQMARGLYGVLIVEEKDPIAVDQDIIMVVDDWLLNNDYQIDETSLGSLHDWSHGGRLGNFLTINGQPQPQFNVKKGERIRLRLLNAANSRIMPLKISGTMATTIAIDGQPVTPSPLKDSHMLLAPAQRVDLILDMMQNPGESVDIEYRTNKGDIKIASLLSHPTIVLREFPLTSSITLPPNPLPQRIPLGDAEHFELEMIGGAMGGMKGAIHDNEWKDIRSLMRKKLIWAMNGIAGIASKPFFRVKRGTSVTIELNNQNRWPHAMHIHGHHFRSIDDQGLMNPIWRDTILIRGAEKRRIAFVADNPGKWLIHCHMIEHAAAGMTAWFEVT